MKKFFLSLSLVFLHSLLFSQENLSYQKPPQEILDLVDYERAPSVIMDSKKENMVFLYRNTYKTLDDLNQEEMRLAGLRINPVTNISSTITYINNIKTRKLNGTQEIQVKGLPENPKISYLSWSPNEKSLAFTHTSAVGVELWVLDIATNTCEKISSLLLNANLGSPLTWFKDGNALLVRKSGH